MSQTDGINPVNLSEKWEGLNKPTTLYSKQELVRAQPPPDKSRVVILKHRIVLYFNIKHCILFWTNTGLSHIL